jgi:hypothetical protein
MQLAVIFLALLLVFGAILGWFHNKQISRIFLTSSKELFEQIAKDVSENFQAEYGPVSTTVRLLSLSPLAKDQDRASRLTRLPILVSVLEAQPEIVALSVGYSDAEYFIIRSLNTSYMVRRFGAPEMARYVVDNIERNNGQPEFTRLFYDKKLHLLAEKDMGFTSYNPTVRPWYRLAVYSRDVTITSPYLFYFIGKVGVTVVREEPDSGNVFAADITLESLSNTLIRNKVSPSSQMLIYTSDNEVIASLEPDSIVVSSGDNELSIAKLSRLKDSVVQDFFQQARQVNNSHFFLDSGGARWIGINKPLSLVGFTANLLILAPEAELLKEAYTIRDQSMIMTIIIILLSLPLALIAARQLALPLKRLANIAKPIQHFDFSQSINESSHVSDIQQLVTTLELTRKTTYGLSKLFNLVHAEQDPAKCIQILSVELLSVANAEGILIYQYRQTRLVPECFRARTGIKIHHNCPSLDTADKSLALVNAFRNDSVTILDINHDQAEGTGVHGSLLNYLGADHLKMAVITTVNRQGDKSGLLCLIFKDNSPTDDSNIQFNDNRKMFYQSLGAFCGMVMDGMVMDGMVMDTHRPLLTTEKSPDKSEPH